MNTSWCIVADDFTGAGDSAVQFCTAGLPARLLLGSGNETMSACRSAIVVDTDSRYLPSEEAYVPVRRLTEALHRHGARRFFKKIDSTLRGNIVEEIRAVMDGAGYQLALVCPAAPRNGRTVVDGVCLLDGVPVAADSPARDRFTPVSDANVASLFESRFPGAIELLDLHMLHQGADALRVRVLDGAGRGTRIFVADARTMDDLGTLAALADVPGLLLAGSSGLAEALAALAIPVGNAKVPSPVRVLPAGKTIFVVGSLTNTSLIQCDRFFARGGVGRLMIDTDAAFADPDAEFSRAMAALRILPERAALLIQTDVSVPAGSREFLKRRGAAVSAFLGRITAAATEARTAGFVFASGGDVAARVVSALGADLVDYTEEVLPGVPYGHFTASTLGRRIQFASKSGGFGTSDSLVDLFARVTGTAAKENIA